MDVDRRHVLFWLAAGPSLIVSGTVSRAVSAGSLPPMTVFRDPNCACCHYWVEHLKAHGFVVTVHEPSSIKAVKLQLGVPVALASCHTGEIGDYVIEGHVPASAIQRLLTEKPKARGLAVPGMPMGSPGMEGGTPEIYDVMLFGDGEPRIFGRFREDKPV